MKLQQIISEKLVLPLETVYKDQELRNEVLFHLHRMHLIVTSLISVTDSQLTQALNEFCDRNYLDTMSRGQIGPTFAYKLAVGFLQQLPVKYLSQRNNKEQPWRTCNSSVHAMLVDYLKPGVLKKGSGFDLDDDYFQRFVKPTGDTTVHEVHTKALQDIGIFSTWNFNLGYRDIDNQLNKGYPVPIAVLHKGTLSAPFGGHIIIVIGKSDDNTYICHDPWGAGFSYTDTNGESVKYPKSSLDKRWLTSTGFEGWGRIVTNVR